MWPKVRKILTISAISVVSTLLLWLPFFLRAKNILGIPLPQNGLATLVANYDGPLYLVVAKTFYNKALISSNFQFPLPTEYYTAHFPLFPILIKVVGVITNYPYAMLAVTLISSILALYYFEKLISRYVNKKDALFLTFVFALVPARWLIVRSVGSPDPLFVAAIIASLFYFKEKKYLYAGLWGAVAQLTKSPGILLFISYLIYMFKDKIDIRKAYPILLIPASLLLTFVLYYIRQGDFFAYFHSGDNIHLFFPPFQIFNYASSWVGTSWLEEIIFVYLIGSLGVYRLFEKKEYLFAIFTCVFFVLSLFVAHRDLIRYSLPMVPFFYIAFSDLLIKKEFKIALGVIIIPIYLFSLAFISQNVMPISNWSPFL